MLGHVSDEALAELYRRCAVFCYPSLGEGFGLPVLEAMAAGAAVVTSNLSSLPEVGGDAVEYVNPHDTGSIAQSLRRLLADQPRRADLGQRAGARAQTFSWERFAEIVLGNAGADSPIMTTPQPETDRVEPLVSVGIPTFQRADKLERAAGSVLNQTHDNIELVISDNASRTTRKRCAELFARVTRG